MYMRGRSEIFMLRHGAVPSTTSDLTLVPATVARVKETRAQLSTPARSEEVLAILNEPFTKIPRKEGRAEHATLFRGGYTPLTYSVKLASIR